MYDILEYNARKIQTFTKKMYISPYTTHRNAIKIMLWKLLTPNKQRIKGIRAIGTVLQKVLLRFRILLCGLVLAETIATAFHAS